MSRIHLGLRWREAFGELAIKLLSLNLGIDDSGEHLSPVRVLLVELAEHSLQLWEDVNVGDSDEQRRLRECCIDPRKSTNELCCGGDGPMFIVVCQ